MIGSGSRVRTGASRDRAVPDIAYVGYLTGNGGDAVQMMHLADGMHRRGRRVQVIVPDSESSLGLSQQCEQAGIECLRTDKIRSDATGPRQELVATIRLIASLRSHVLHFHTGNSCMPRLTMLALALSRAPRGFVTVHSPYQTIDPASGRAKFWSRSVRRQLHAVISPSDHGSNFQKQCGILSRQVVTIRNAIDIPNISAGDGSIAREHLGVGRHDPLIVFSSRLEEQKRPVDAVRMLAGVAAEFPTARLVFVGSGSISGAISAAAHELGLEGRVHLVGFQRNIPDWLAAATVWVLPTERENFSVAVLEALAAGCPILSTNCVGNDEILVNDHNSLTFGVGDVEAGTVGLGRLLGDAALRARLGNRAQECAQEYSLGRMVDQYESMYESYGALPASSED